MMRTLGKLARDCSTAHHLLLPDISTFLTEKPKRLLAGLGHVLSGRGNATFQPRLRDSVVTYHHQTCTAKMGRDSMSVVDGHLKVYGIANLRIADASIMPRVTTGNTMAPCVIIGERAGEILKADHKL
jgi:choline dehydrogenase-like flavoprotein